jgi:isopentenyl diphosphate isomerase/L-lactate dehydrogenase-like FMN-dependent dehydrogenase
LVGNRPARPAARLARRAQIEQAAKENSAMSIDPQTSRRLFLKFLAASPLVTANELAAFAGEAPSRLPDPMIWAPRDAEHLISSPKEATSVFDLELVMHKNVPPGHFGYMASGIDDEVTLRANREGFLKYQLRPRRLVDVSKVDMSADILGVKYASPIIVAPTGGHRAYHPDGEIGVATAAKRGDHLMILSTQASTSIEDVTKARGQPIWYQLYATNKFEVAKHHVQRAEKAGALAVAVTVDRNGGRNQETLFRFQRTDTRQCADCHDNSSLVAAQRDKPMYEGVDLSGLRNIQSSAMSWDYIKRLRDLTRMKIVLKGILAWEDAKIAADSGIDAIIVSNHGGRADEAGRSTIESLQEIIEASGNMPVLIDSGFRRGTDIVKALCIGAKGVAVGRPYLWGLGAFGQAGVDRALEILRTELLAAMQQTGAPSLKQLTPAMVKHV